MSVSHLPIIDLLQYFVQEIINVAKTPKTPGLTIYLQEMVSEDKNIAELVVSLLEYTVLGDLVKRTEIYYDPDVKNTVVAKDREFVKHFYDYTHKSDDDLRRLSPVRHKTSKGR
jgi:DNA-directed RNA polymerase II subunit RPB1